MDKRKQFSLLYFLIAIALILIVQDRFLAPREVALLYGDFKRLLKNGDISEVYISEQTLRGKGNLHGLQNLQPSSSPSLLSGTSSLSSTNSDARHFTTVRIDDKNLIDDLDQAGVRYGGEVESRWLATLLSWILPAVFFVAIWSFAINRMSPGGGAMSIGKSKAKVYMETDTRVTFSDVAGVDEAKQELVEVVDFLKNPQRYGRLGAHIPKGVLLVGPPGTGKTLLARAVAGEARVPFLSISGSEFVEMFVGVGAARVRDLFQQARAMAPAIIFIDELDALGRARGANPLMSNDEKEQTLNQLLVEMDGFDPSVGLILIAASNRPEILDPALLRAGRFDRQVLVDRPDKIGRAQILRVHVKKITLDNSLDIEQVAALTPGFTGADLANLVNEAALLATRRNADSVNLADFTAAIERLIAGLEKKNRLLNPKEREVVAWHEMGHTLVAMSLPDTDPVHKVSIIPRGIGALGYTMQRPTQDRFLLTQQELQHRMTVLLAGRAAELLTFNQISTGAADDLVKATDIARSMVMRFGMNEKLGQVSYERQNPGMFNGTFIENRRDYSDATAQAIDNAIRQLVDGALMNALAILKEKQPMLDRCARRLLEKETLTGDELKAMLSTIEARPTGEDQPAPDKTNT